MMSYPIDAMSAPAVARNRDAILAVLRQTMPSQGTVLEIASGTGEHVVHFAAELPHLTWQPSEVDETALASIAAHRALARLPNVLPPIVLDVAHCLGRLHALTPSFASTCFTSHLGRRRPL
jgi:Protein of unknown function (DUF938)